MKNDLRDDLKSTMAELAGPEPDEVDEAVSIIRRARKILDDGRLMAAVRRRLDENRAAVAASTKDDDDA